MVLIDSFIIEFELVWIGISATILFGIGSKGQIYLMRWFYVIFSSTIGLIFNFLENYLDVFEIYSIAFYGIAIILATIIIIKEYYDTFLQKPKPNLTNINMTWVYPLIFSSILFGFFLLLFDLILQIRITLKKKKLTYICLCITLFGAVLTTLGNAFINLEFEGAITINVGVDLFFTSMLITTGVIALLEKQVMKSEMKYKESFNRASFYKDLVAHDINNILQNIQSFSDLLSFKLEEESDELKGLRIMINDQVERGTRLVKNVRTLSEIEEFKYSLIKFDALKVLKESVNFINNSYSNKKIKIEITTEYDEAIVNANELLSDVFENLLNNAIKHGNNENLKISIIIDKQEDEMGSYFQFQFKDNGTGIPDYLKKQIFSRSFHKDRSISGMGLGLSLVREIIESYDGKIWVEDNIKGDHSKGCNFILIIPSS